MKIRIVANKVKKMYVLEQKITIHILYTASFYIYPTRPVKHTG